MGAVKNHFHDELEHRRAVEDGEAPAFTPGPWSLGPWIDSAGGHVYRVVKAASRNVSAVSVYGKRSDGTVGGQKLKGGGHSKTVASEECDANAHLIAAAPELYEALERAAKMLDGDNRASDRPSDFRFGIVREFNALLAKARGDA